MALSWVRCDYLLGDILLQQLAILLNLVLHNDEGSGILRILPNWGVDFRLRDLACVVYVTVGAKWLWHWLRPVGSHAE